MRGGPDSPGVRQRRTVVAMLSRLQDRRGEPTLRVRALAALVILGLVVLTAPLVMVPFLAWLAHQV
ncbi:MAG TPA: hypothetical protein VMH41_03825 [Mycobacteriales bacterium]|nr:hypothetical protein [Mycobacteriales bacterium]